MIKYFKASGETVDTGTQAMTISPLVSGNSDKAQLRAGSSPALPPFCAAMVKIEEWLMTMPGVDYKDG